MKFIGREKELKELNNRYNSKNKEFGIIYGRRRIGKSSLINEFLKDKNAILFQAKKDNAFGNLKSFSFAINNKLNLPKNYIFSSWEEAFDALKNHEKNHRFILAIDEYPYIIEQDSSFSSIIQEFIDNADNNIFLILSGSDISFLKNEILNHNSPLYKRRTFQMQINKLSFEEATLFLKDFDIETKCKYLSIFSTYPYYLSSINHQISFEENIKYTLFNQFGTFFSLQDQLLSNSTKIQDVYNAILVAITHKKRSNKEIADYIHEEEAKVAKYLITLQESEIVSKCETFMGNKKTIYYEINDMLLKFWYKFIFPNEDRIKINSDIVFKELQEQIKQFISFGFEDVCRLYLNQKNINGELNTVYPPLKPYKVEKSQLNRSIEIDGLSQINNSLLIIECKFRNTKFNKIMLEHLIESTSVFSNKLDRYYYIFSKVGFDDDVIKMKSKNINLITMEDLFVNN